MPLRVFHCQHCEHRLRLGATTCGSCGKPTTVWNWSVVHLALALMGALAVIYLIAR